MTTHYEKYTIKDHKGNFCASDSKGNIKCTSTDPGVNERFNFHILENMHTTDRFGLANYRGKYCVPTNTNLIRGLFDHTSNDFQEMLAKIGNSELKREGCDITPNFGSVNTDLHCKSNGLKCTEATTDFPYELHRYKNGKISFKKDNKWCTTDNNGCLICDSLEKTPEALFEIWKPVPKSELYFGNTIDRFLNLTLDECVLKCARNESCMAVSYEHRDGCNHPEPCALSETLCHLKSDIVVINTDDPLFTHVNLNRKDLEPYLLDDTDSTKWGMGSGRKPRG